MQPPSVSSRSAATTGAGPNANRLAKRLAKHRTLLVMLLPGLVYFTLFKYVPMGGIAIAFQKYNLEAGIWGSDWIGWGNFRRFFEGVYASQIIGNTVVISLYKLVFGFPAPILLALLLDQVRRAWFKRVIQTMTYVPHFMSWVIIYGIMMALMAPGDGLINQLLKHTGLPTVSFLTEPSWIRPLLVGSDIWQGAGWGAIIYLAALAAIDPHLYEAARVDGASPLRLIWHVTLPGIRNIVVVMLVLRLSHILDVGFDQVFMMANAFNSEKADIIDTWVYRVGLQEMQIGLASAVGLFKSAIGLVLVLAANQFAKKLDSQIW
ncbi:MAG: sugar ABC transporter permease [Paenibacillaceae bacterium]|nr:sugar ABC transporter permease [Paenibacillaceae bacterium]